MKILIDADACPVVEKANLIAKQYCIETIICCDTSHNIKDDYATIITVSKGPDSVDFRLVKEVNNGDIVISQDYGLCAMAISKGAICINQNGLIIDNENIEALLTKRYISSKERKKGVRVKGPKKRQEIDGIKFVEALIKIIERQS